MRICIVAEGCYPYIVGGVSSWIQSLISEMKEHEFYIITINPEKKFRGKFLYELPSNVVEVQEIFFDELFNKNGKWNKKIKLSLLQRNAVKSLLNGDNVDWHIIYDLFTNKNRRKAVKSMDLLLSKVFYDLIQESYSESYFNVPFTEIFWTLRSMYSLLFSLFEIDYIDADLIHCVSTGYAGIIGSFISYNKKKPLILTEHGIYTREREEELIKSNWVQGNFKDIWINYFKNLSTAIYDDANRVIALYKKSSEIQVRLGCDRNKINIIHNGVKLEKYKSVKKIQKNKTDPIIVAGIVRVVPIKDIITMLNAFSIVEKHVENVEFLIIGPIEENKEYYEECLAYMKFLKLKNTTFTGRVNVIEYLGKIDIHVLTSISEGQPLTVLETLACKIPNVVTNVGSCSYLINGEVNDDKFGEAGFVSSIMDYNSIAENIIELIENKEMRIEMGLNGYNRVNKYYSNFDFIDNYRKLYGEIIKE